MNFTRRQDCMASEKGFLKNEREGSDEALEPVLLCLADRADPRGLLPCAKVAADPAAPDGKREGRKW